MWCLRNCGGGWGGLGGNLCWTRFKGCGFNSMGLTSFLSLLMAFWTSLSAFARVANKLMAIKACKKVKKVMINN